MATVSGSRKRPGRDLSTPPTQRSKVKHEPDVEDAAIRVAALPYSQIESLPIEVLDRIFSYLDFRSIRAVDCVSYTFKKVAEKYEKLAFDSVILQLSQMELVSI